MPFAAPATLALRRWAKALPRRLGANLEWQSARLALPDDFHTSLPASGKRKGAAGIASVRRGSLLVSQILKSSAPRLP
ncbi:hypothetical protein CBM2606_A10158 [Cupriavidus taiwanensis]|nr:hypothetical protein CBM2606_A10158 [Cupriavidus taiwanensis]